MQPAFHERETVFDVTYLVETLVASRDVYESRPPLLEIGALTLQRRFDLLEPFLRIGGDLDAKWRLALFVFVLPFFRQRSHLSPCSTRSCRHARLHYGPKV